MHEQINPLPAHHHHRTPSGKLLLEHCVSVWRARWIRGAPPGRPFKMGVGCQRGQSGQQMALTFGSSRACLGGREQPSLAHFRQLSPVAAGRPGPAPLCVTVLPAELLGGGSSFVGPWSQLTPLPDPAALITQMLHSSEASPTQTLSPHLLQRGHPSTSRSELAVSMWSDLEDTLLIYTLVTFPFRLSFRFLFCNTSNKCLPI